MLNLINFTCLINTHKHLSKLLNEEIDEDCIIRNILSNKEWLKKCPPMIFNQIYNLLPNKEIILNTKISYPYLLKNDNLYFEINNKIEDLENKINSYIEKYYDTNKKIIILLFGIKGLQDKIFTNHINTLNDYIYNFLTPENFLNFIDIKEINHKIWNNKTYFHISLIDFENKEFTNTEKYMYLFNSKINLNNLLNPVYTNKSKLFINNLVIIVFN